MLNLLDGGVDGATLARTMLIQAGVGPLNNQEGETIGDQYEITEAWLDIHRIEIVNRGVRWYLMVHQGA